jgi:DNA-binding phage protein
LRSARQREIRQVVYHTQLEPMRILDVEDVVRLLRSEVKRAGGQVAWASKTGLNRIVVNKVLNGKTLPTKKIVRALKLRIVYISELEPPRSK